MESTPRETQVIKTPIDGIELVVKTYLTGREMRQVENLRIEGTQFDPVTQQAKGSVSGELADKAQDKLLEITVVSVGGSTENVVEKIVDLKKPDYDFVVAQVRDISQGVAFADKKKLS
jgi:hypothetical protein